MDWYSWLSKTNIDPILVYEYGLAFVRNELQEEDLTYFDHEFLQSIGISIAKHRLEILKLARKEARRSSSSSGSSRTASNGFSRFVLAMSKTRKALAKNIIIGKWGFLHRSSSNSLPRFPATEAAASPSPYRNQWSGALKRVNNGGTAISSTTKEGRGISRDNNVMWSGPLDHRRMQLESSNNNKQQIMVCQSVSGPLDYGKMMLQHQQESTRSVQVGPNWSPLVVRDKMMGGGGLFCKSPTINGPVERWGGLISPKVNYSPCGRPETVGGGGGEGDDDLGVQSLWSLMFQDMKPT